MLREPLLIVDDDPFVLGLLVHVAESRGLTVVGVSSPDAAADAAATQPFGAAIVDLQLGADSGLDVIKRLRAHDPTIEAIVISADRRLSSAIESIDLQVFAFLPKPLDPDQVFVTAERALERRRDAMERRRLTGELALLNELAEIVTGSLELGVVLQRALERVGLVFGARWGAIRLRSDRGAAPETRARIGPAGAPLDRMQRLADAVLAEGRVRRIARDDGGADTAAIAAPIHDGETVAGVLALLADDRDAFSELDGDLLASIGRQIGIAVGNARLYERVHRAKMEWERTFDAISEPIAVFDAARRTMRTNAAMATLRGWPIVHSQGRSCDDTGLCGGGPACLVQQALDGQSASAEITTPEGRIFAITTLPVPADRAAVLVAKEVTEERTQARRLRALSDELSVTNAALTHTVEQLQETQAQLVQSGKLSAIGELVAGVAHELNNPLTSIIGYAQLVEEAVRQVEPDAPMLADLGIVMAEAERAASIVRNLLTFARRQSTERAMTSLREVCERVEALRAYDRQVHHIASVIDVPADLPLVWADAAHLQQALLNLVINAEHAVAGRPSATITFVGAVSAEANAVTLSVIDTGSGIAPDHLPRVFDPFFTTRSVGEGTGLGLSITYGIVRDHGGEIWVDSVPGRTCFTMRLPARLEPRVHHRGAVVAHGDTVARDFLVALLAGWGLSVRGAANARDAAALLSARDVDVAVLHPTAIPLDPSVWGEPSRGGAGPCVIAIGADGPSDAARWLRARARVTVPWPATLPQLWPAVLAALTGPLLE